MSSPVELHHQTVAASVQPPTVSRERQALAKRILLDAPFLGSLGDALLHDGFGIGLLPWVAVLAAVFVFLLRQRNARLTREQGAWLGAALFFAAAFAWRDSSALLFYDFVAIIVALGFLGATVSEASPIRSILGRRVRELFYVMRRAITDGC